MTSRDGQHHTRRRMVDLRILLVTAITGLVILGVTGATVPQVLAFRDFAKQSAIAAVTSAAEAKRAEAEAIFKPASDILAHALQLPLDDLAGGGPEERQGQYENFVRGVEAKALNSKNVAATFVAQTDRSMVSLVSNSPKLSAVGRLDADTAHAPWLRVETYVDAGTTRWGWRTETGWDFAERPIGDYDPRTRPWWRMVENGTETVLSGVYRSNLDDSIRMTLAAPIRDASDILIAVAGVDTHIKDLARAVREIELSKNSFAFIARADGSVIAHPRLDLPARLSKHVANAPNLLEIEREDPRDLFLYDAFANGPSEGILQYDVDGKTWFGVRLPLRDLPGVDAFLYAGAPLEDFTAASERALRSGLIISGVLALAVILVGAIIARAIARPVRNATDAMRAIARLDPIDSLLPEQSSLAEIDALNKGVEVLGAAIRSFSRFAPTELVRDLLEMRQPLELGGTRREITVMFVDLQGFTSSTESEQHERVVRGLADYFEVICSAVTATQGTLDKFIGDGAMAFWGAPRDDGDHTDHACEAVKQIVSDVEALNKERTLRGEDRLRVRFGLHRGYAFVGNVGARDRFAYTALGDVVNTAARLETSARDIGATALVTKDVALNAPSSTFECKGKIDLRGKAQPVDLFEICLTEKT